MRASIGHFSRRVLALVTGLALQACNGSLPPTLQIPPHQQGSFHLDATRLVESLAAKTSRSWQDGITDSIPAVRRLRLARHNPSYKVAAVGVTAYPALSGACSSIPAYAKAGDVNNTTGPGPLAGDCLYVVLDSGVVQKIDPVTGAVLQAVTLAGRTFSKSAVVVSGDNNRLYLLSTDGYLIILDAKSITTVLASKRLCAAPGGFAGQSPFLDYGLNTSGGNTNFGSMEHVFAMSVDGSIYHVEVDQASYGTPLTTPAINAWTSSNGTDKSLGYLGINWTTQASIGYGAPVIPGSTPIFWQGSAYIGMTNGTYYRIHTDIASPGTNIAIAAAAAAPASANWNLAAYTSAPLPLGRACSAPAALDFDNALTVTAIFAPCGDRVCWINPANGKVCESPALVVDNKPAPAKYQGLLSNFPYNATVLPGYVDNDYVCAAKAALPAPNIWGSGGATLPPLSAGLSCATIKQQPAGPYAGFMWAGLYVNSLMPGNVGGVQSIDLTATTNPAAPFHSSKSNVNEIAFDGAGNCYASHGASPVIAKFNNAGVLQVLAAGKYTFPAGKGNALWPQPDGAGNLWCTGFSGQVCKFDPTGTLLPGFPVAVGGSFGIAVDGGGNALVVTSGGKLVKMLPGGGLAGAPFPISVGTNLTYVAIEPVTNNIWIVDQGANRIYKYSPAGALLKTIVPAGPTGAWCLAFDAQAQPWVGFTGSKQIVQYDAVSGAPLQTQAAGGAPYEIAFDGNGDLWASCSNGTFKYFSLGNLSDLFATDGYLATADGNDSLAYLMFKIAAGNYGGKPPVAAEIDLTAANTPLASEGVTETLEMYRTLPTLNNGAPVPPIWQGYGNALNVTYTNRPLLFESFPFASLTTNPTVDTKVQYILGTSIPTDAVNSADPKAVWSYGFRAVGKPLKNAAHWYSNTTAPAGARPPENRPQMVVSVASKVLPSTSGIRCQPIVDTDINKIYVESSNCVFELPYNAAQPADFSTPAKCCYNLTMAGQTGGPLNLAATTYLYPLGNMQQNFYGDLMVVDQDDSGAMYANRFTRNFFATPTVSHLAAAFDATPGTGTIGQALVWDYDKGSVYFTTSNSRLIRGSLY
jgi:hypothetical protein